MGSAIKTLKSEVESLKTEIAFSAPECSILRLNIELKEHQRAIEILQSANLNTK
jgi:hypothetical protein